MKANCLGDLIAGVKRDFDLSEIVLDNGETVSSSLSEAVRIVEYYRGFIGSQKDGAQCFVKDLERFTCASARTFELVSEFSRKEKPGSMSLTARLSFLKEINSIASRRNPKPGYQYDCFA
jgi:hypothetical protein